MAGPQMTLFEDLPVPSDAAAMPPRRSRVWAPWRIAVLALLRLKQQALTWRLRALESDLDTEWDRPVHRVATAAQADPVQVLAPPSIWALAQSCKGMRSRGRFGDAAGLSASAPLLRVERDGDRTRVVRLRPEETAEWQEREYRRRQRQRPPKPSAKVKTRGKKVRAWDGESSDE